MTRFKKGVVTLLAFLAIAGSTVTLAACSAKHINPGTSGDNNPRYEQTEEDKGGKEVNPGDNTGGEEVNPGDNTGGEEVNPGDENPSDPEIDEEETAQQQRAILESGIESTILQKLNANFEEELVENVDIKYFSLEQDDQLKTTFFANGTIKFAGDTSIHEFSLGTPLDGDSFNALAPLYYVEIDQNKDLVFNYSFDDLTAVKSYIEAQNLNDAQAQLDGRNWDLNMLTPAQMEKQLEEDFEARSVVDLGEKYLKNVDFKYFSTEYYPVYGYMLKINGETGNIYNDDISSISVKIVISQADYEYLNNYVLTNSINENDDLKDNYSAEQFSQVSDIINSDTSSVKFYKINDMDYIVENESDMTL